MTPPRWIRAAAWVVLFAALGAAAAAWFTPTPEVDAAAAAALVQRALADVDLDAEITGAPRKEQHRSRDGERVPVWTVVAETEVDGRTEQIELRVQRSAGRFVYVDDRIGPDDGRRLLTDAEFAAVGAHHDDSAHDRWVRRNLLAAVSALLIAATCAALATRSDQLWSPR